MAEKDTAWENMAEPGRAWQSMAEGGATFVRQSKVRPDASAHRRYCASTLVRSTLVRTKAKNDVSAT